jgi:transglutaminase-like putative cysteine protease
MKALLTGVCLTIFIGHLSAQKAPVKFGDVAMADMTMTSYANDTSATAVILADFGQSTISYNQSTGFNLQFERIKRIKILTTNGLSWADFSIPLYKSGSTDEKLSGLKAITYNLEKGKIVETKLKNDGIFRETFDEGLDYVKVTCPNVRVGSVIEITYKVTSEFLFHFQDWSFQSTIPTVMSEYRAHIPEYFTYDKYMQGYISLDVSDETRVPASIVINSFERSENSRVVQSTATSDRIDYMETRNRWVANNVPAFKPEPFMTSLHDYVSKINFELAVIRYPNQPAKQYMGSWADINNSFVEDENFGGQIKGNAFLKKIAEEVTAGIADDADKIAAISNFIRANIAWDGNQRKYPQIPLRKVFDNKKGNSAEINLLMASMLEKLNIAVTPVLLSTRDHGLLREATPVSSQFNYVICMAQVKDKTFLLDATETLLPPSILPERCLNGRGLAVSKEGFKWVALESKFKTRMVTSADLGLSPTGQLAGKLKLDCNGYRALSKRKHYLINGEKEYVKNVVGSHSWELKSSEIQNAKEIQKNFVEVHDLIVNENMTLAGEIIYLDPFIYSSYKVNPFKSETREYPVDFGSPHEETFFIKLAVPENYTVDELPKSIVLSMPENAAKYTYNVSHTGNMITVTSMFHINKSLYSQVEYPYLREFYNQVVAKQAEQIVLKKKSF